MISRISRKADAFIIWVGTLALILCFTMPCMAADIHHQSKKSNNLKGTEGGAQVQITGTVVLPPPCIVNNDKLFIVEFGDVRIDLIDGVSYHERDIPVSIYCDGAVSGQLQLSLQGDSLSGDASLLTTSDPGLGIKIKRSGIDFPLNNWVDVNNLDDFKLSAIPVKLPANKLEAGEFTATATFIVKQD
ncbi:MAG TPA: fimbrial protein [Buttiauxella sp.]|jgi:type 1 fimbria pilin